MRGNRISARLTRSVGGGVFLLALVLPSGPVSTQPVADAVPSSAVLAGPVTPIPEPPRADPRKVALGKLLFEDTALSHDGTRACTSCHDTGTNGASMRARDLSATGKPLSFNTLTVFNAALNFRLGWNGRYRTLEEQAEGSINHPETMASSVPEVVARLRADPAISHDFAQAYGRSPDRAALLDAIATYERSLVTPGAPFDRWLGGEPGAISPQAAHGYDLFVQFGCISCHQGANIGGNLFEEQGIFHPLTGPPLMLRVPSLRNVAITAPYFHDGSVTGLDDAVRDMARAQLDRSLDDADLAAIVAFLRTLTGRIGTGQQSTTR